MDRQDLTAPEASKRCLDGHVADVLHERTGDHPLKKLFPFSHNWTTYVANDLNEAQRKRLTSSQGVDVTFLHMLKQ